MTAVTVSACQSCQSNVINLKHDQSEINVSNVQTFALLWTDEGTTILGHFKAFMHPLLTYPPGLACVMQDLKL